MSPSPHRAPRLHPEQRLGEIATEAERLIAAGEWNRDAFERLRCEALAAAPEEDDGWAVEILAPYAEPDWLEP